MFANNTAPIVGEANVTVPQPPNRVFEFVGVGFIDHYPQWSPQVQEIHVISAGEFGLDTVAKQVTVDQGRVSEATFKVAAFEPPSAFGLIGIDEPFRCLYRFVQDTSPSCTQISFTYEILEVAMYMRPFQKLLRSAVQEGAEQTLANIQRLLDGGQLGECSDGSASSRNENALEAV